MQEWLERLPRGAVGLTEESLEFEHVYDLEPRNRHSSPLELRVGKNCGTFDVGVGRGTQFDDIPCETALLLEILDAVAAGRVSERLLVRRGKTLLTEGCLELAGGSWTTKRAVFWTYLLRFLPPRPSWKTIRYEPHWRTKRGDEFAAGSGRERRRAELLESRFRLAVQNGGCIDAANRE